MLPYPPLTICSMRENFHLMKAPGSVSKEPAHQSLGRKVPWRSAWQLTPVFLPGDSHRKGRLVGCSPWGHKESDTIERLNIAHTGISGFRLGSV